MVDVEGPTRCCFLDKCVLSVGRSATPTDFGGGDEAGMVSNSAWSRLRRMLGVGLGAACDETADEPVIAAVVFGKPGRN